MTIEQKLKAIIEAQVKGGFIAENWVMWSPNSWDLVRACLPNIHIVWQDDNGNQFQRNHILEILLDPQGLKAAYDFIAFQPLTVYKSDSPIDIDEESFYSGQMITGTVKVHSIVPYRILDAWLSGGAIAAINTAFDLLPKH